MAPALLQKVVDMAPSVTAPVLFEIEPGVTKEFRFTVASALALEKRAGGSPAMLIMRTQLIEANILMLTYALQHQDASLNEARATKLYTKFIETGGDANALREALLKALAASGVYGRKESADAEDADATDPTSLTTTTTAHV